MTTEYISFEQFSCDETDWHVQISASNDGFCGTQDFYIEPETLGKLGADFCEFPTSIKDEVCFQLGDRAGNWAYFVLVRAFLVDSVGHSAIEFSVGNHSTPPYNAQATFSIYAEVASINRLGQQLQKWVIAPDEPLIWVPQTS